MRPRILDTRTKQLRGSLLSERLAWTWIFSGLVLSDLCLHHLFIVEVCFLDPFGFVQREPFPCNQEFPHTPPPSPHRTPAQDAFHVVHRAVVDFKFRLWSFDGTALGRLVPRLEERAVKHRMDPPLVRQFQPVGVRGPRFASWRVTQLAAPLALRCSARNTYVDDRRSAATVARYVDVRALLRLRALVADRSAGGKRHRVHHMNRLTESNGNVQSQRSEYHKCKNVQQCLRRFPLYITCCDRRDFAVH